MKLFPIILLLLFMVTGCCPCRHLTTGIQAKDSTRIEVRTHTVFVPDTLFIEIPAQQAERMTQDSTSHLENDYSTSDARITSDGSLFHNLKTKPQAKSIPTNKQIEYRDSIVYQDKAVTVTNTIEVERQLTWLQKTQIYGFWAALIILVILYRRKIFALIVRLFLSK